MSNNSGSGGDANTIYGIIALIVIALILIYMWRGASWAFAQYIDLLHVN